MSSSKQLLLLADCSLIILALFFGSQLVEAFILVPYWQRLAPAQFLEWYQEYGGLLKQFFTPLTITAVLLPLILWVGKWHQQQGALFFNGLTVILLLMVLSTYFLYFKATNTSFLQASISVEQVAATLLTWEKWHLGRLCLEFLALLSLWGANRKGATFYFNQ
ncbi:MAG: hypothetical protein ACRBFS_26550 [Aureispira sp.]